MENSLEKVLFFQGMEHRFARIAKSSVVVVGLTGGWLLYVTGEWHILFSHSRHGTDAHAHRLDILSVCAPVRGKDLQDDLWMVSTSRHG